MYYSHAIEILDNFEAGIYTEDDVMKAIDKILSMETINAVRKDLLLKALRFARQRIDWDDYWNNANTQLKEQEPKKVEWRIGRAHCPSCGELFPRKKETRYIRFCSFCGQAVKWE